MKINKVLFIHAAHYAADGKRVSATGLLNRLTVPRIADLALPLLAAYTPTRIAVELVDEYFADVDLQSDADVIAISAQIIALQRTQELAQAFRARGKVVVTGGFLASMHPEAISPYVDALCIGEGDAVWPQMLEDIEAGTLKKIYRGERAMALDRLPVPHYQLIKKDRFVSYPIQALRGCPFRCTYCSIASFFDGSYQARPVQDVVRDIKATQSKYIHFSDDNLMENRRYAKELFKAMIDLNVIWGAQVTINVARDPELLRLAHRAGCRMLAIGVESLSQETMNALDKPFNKVEKYSQAFQAIHDSGIGVHALIVFGLPQDTEASYVATLSFLEASAVPIAEFFMYTPYPKTIEGQRLQAQGRIIDYDLNHYREGYVVFKHDHMSANALLRNYWSALRRFYSLRSIVRRIVRGSYKNKWLHLANNLGYWIKVKRNIIPVYFGKGNEWIG